MPHFTLQTSPSGPIIDMHVNVSQARLHALQAAQQQIPALQPVRALVDTGASCTCVDPSVLTQLGLQPTGATRISTPSTDDAPFSADTYDVSILIPVAKQPPLILPNVPIVAAKLLGPQGFHALLGRDILQRCILTYNGSIGLFTLAY